MVPTYNSAMVLIDTVNMFTTCMVRIDVVVFIVSRNILLRANFIQFVKLPALSQEGILEIQYGCHHTSKSSGLYPKFRGNLLAF